MLRVGRPLLAFAAVLALFPAAPAAGESGGGPVADSPQEVRPLLIGARLPSVTVSTGEGAPFDLGKAFGKKPTVLILYRGGW